MRRRCLSIVDGRRTTTDAGPLVYYKLTYEPVAQVSLKVEVDACYCKFLNLNIFA